MCTTKQYSANTGIVNISVANPNLNGTGAIVNVLTGADTGTEINSITIKATGNTSEGMVRLFIKNEAYSLYREIPIQGITPTAVVKSFQTTIFDTLVLNPGEILAASTQNAESFNILVNGTNWTQCNCTTDVGACCGDTQYIADTGIAMISTANPNLNGTGAMSSVITGAAAPAGIGGTMISSVYVKGAGSSSEGMVRLFINNGTTNFLVKEIYIPATTQSGIQPAFKTKSLLKVFLNTGYSLLASTQNANIFNVFTFASDWVNCPCLP